jgi:hypothetical protein
MSVELRLPIGKPETARTTVEAPAVEAGFPIRAHHLPIYRSLLTSIMENPKINMFVMLNRTASSHAQGWSKSTRYSGVDYREHHGRASDDATLPDNYPQDLMNGSVGEYAKRLRKAYFDFLVLPDQTPVTVGPVIDRICESCFFHQGNGGGLHCQTVWMPNENDKAHEMKGQINKYLAMHDRPEVPFYPDFVRSSSVEASAPLRGKTYGGKAGNSAEQFTVPLGLIRDTFVYDISRIQFAEGADNIYTSYQDYLQSH